MFGGRVLRSFLHHFEIIFEFGIMLEAFLSFGRIVLSF